MIAGVEAGPRAIRLLDLVRGDLGSELSSEVLGFCSENWPLSEAEAVARLRTVVSVLRDDDGIAGVGFASQRRIEEVGNRTFWIYEALLRPGASESDRLRMLEASFAALEAEYTEKRTGPIGLALLIANQAMITRRPEAIWPELGLMYAGYTRDREQIRLAYFEDARV